MTHSPNSQGIDSISLIGNYKTVLKMVKNMGLSVNQSHHNSPVSDYVKKFKNLQEEKQRYKVEKFSPVVEVVKLTKGKSVSNYMMIIKNIPVLFDLATVHKKTKDTFCMVVFTGLHQPTKKVESEAIKLMSKFLKRKTFKRYSVDVAIDIKDPKPINKDGLKAFKSRLKPYSNHRVTLPSNGATSYYINNIKHLSISRILYYDKYLKQTQHHKQKGINKEWKYWKRLEITLTFDVTVQDNKGFTQYIDDNKFIADMYDINNILKSAKVKNYSHDYLLLQVNSILDNRFLNNNQSREQFNSVKALERFKKLDLKGIRNYDNFQ